MSKDKIKKDAENVSIKKNILLSIGGKINKNFPKYQYMGIFKLRKKDYFSLKKIFVKIKKPKIDMTNFLNTSIKNYRLKLRVKIYRSYWYEIDNNRDIIVSSKELE